MKNQDLVVVASGVVEEGARLVSRDSLCALEMELQMLGKHAFVVQLLCHHLDDLQGEKKLLCSLALEDYLEFLDSDISDLVSWFNAIHGGRSFSMD